MTSPEYYMGKDSSLLSRLLYFHYFNILPAYYNDFRGNKPVDIDRKLVAYRPEYEPMTRNPYMWRQYKAQGSSFRLWK